MHYSKALMTGFVVVMIAALTLSSAGAQSGVPPVGEVDEDGDLIIGVFPPLDLENAAGLPVLNFTDLQSGDGLPTEIQPDVPGPPTPLYPAAAAVIYEKYPRYSFTEVIGATKYKVEVYNTIPEPDVLLYTLKGDGGDCSCGCNLYPTLTLKPLDVNLTKGFYKWRVVAKWEGYWRDWSVFNTFMVLKNGFNSSFNAPTTAWYPIPVTIPWVLTDTGYAKTLGELNKMTSAVEKHVITQNYVYEVMMKRKYTNAYNYVYFQGYPLPLSTSNFWDDGYYFAYSNNGDWALNKTIDGAFTHIAGGTSTYIKPNDWNKITIFMSTSSITLWVNEHGLGTYYDTTPTFGLVGFGMVKSEDIKSPLLVDWARLEYTTISPYGIPEE